MAGTTRPRKTAAAKAAADSPEETAAPAEVEPQEATSDAEGQSTPQEATPDADSTPKAPDAAPLEPPAVEAPEEPPAAPVYANPTEVIPDDANLADVIIDDATKQPPADPSKVFQPLTPYGSTLVCTVRLVERTHIGPHSNPIERLLQPAGAHVSEGVAARIQERLDAQAERLAAPADPDSTES